MRRTCICILIAWIIVLQGIVYLYTNNMKKKIEHHVSVSSTSSTTTTTNEEIQPTNVIINQRTNLLRKEISPLQVPLLLIGLILHGLIFHLVALTSCLFYSF